MVAALSETVVVSPPAQVALSHSVSFVEGISQKLLQRPYEHRSIHNRFGPLLLEGFSNRRGFILPCIRHYKI